MAPPPAVAQATRTAGVVAAARALRTILAFAAHAGVARVLGLESYGEFAFVLALQQLGAFVSLHGLPSTTVRYVASYAGSGRLGLLRGFLGWSAARALLGSLATALLGLAAACLVPMEPSLRTTLALGAVSLPLTVLLLLQGSRLQALRPSISDLPEGVVRPLVGLGLLLAATGLAGVAPEAPAAVVLFALSAGAAAALAAAWGRRALPSGLAGAAPERLDAEWTRAGGHLFLSSAGFFVLASSGVILVGAGIGVEAAGPYAAAQRIALVTAFGLASAQVLLAPSAARASDVAALRPLVTRVARLTFAGATAALLGIAAFGPFALSLFGEGFGAAYAPLLILTGGQWLAALCGPAGLLLAMTGHERDLARVTGPCAIAGVAASAGLLWLWGPAGAAAGTAGAAAMSAAVLKRLVRARLGFAPGIFGR